MSPNRPRRGRQQTRRPANSKGTTDGNKKAGKQRRSRQTANEHERPFWANDAADAEVQNIIGVVTPSQDPTAIVRSLGSPPLGKFADNAQHYYAAVYETAQRFAIAMANANGVLVPDSNHHDQESSTATDTGSR